MLEREREEAIIQHLQRRRFARVHDLVAVTAASEATIRRDLQRMDTNGLLKRVRGGAECRQVAPAAVPHSEAGRSAAQRRWTADSAPLRTRITINDHQKRRIAAAAARLCRDGNTLFIDGGSTTYYLAEFLEARELTIVTNSLAIANQTNYTLGCQTIIAGGIIDPQSELVFDPVGRDFFSDYSADILFMGVAGITEHGITNTHGRVVQTARQMIAHAARIVVLADSSKFRAGGHILLCGLETVDTIVTDAGVSQTDRERAAAAGVELIVV
ncbi:MAG: DeoR/GlpR transcriptional regulator [Spirochaetaceae bacterium]|nr:MAG: DeoR/GlpR transcriptional regulator [Spirochaetaceae bacterium]